MRKQIRLSFRDGVDQTYPTALHRYFYSLCGGSISGRRVLDLGCWTGSFALLVNDPKAFVGVDIDNRAIAIAAQHNPDKRFVLASGLRLPFKDNSFDVVTMWAVIEHLPRASEGECLKEINRVLVADGLIFLNTMSSHLASKVLDPAYFLKDHRHYSVDQLLRLLREAGFAPHAVSLNGRFFTPLYLGLSYFFKHVLRRPMPRTVLLEEMQRRDYEADGFNETNVAARKTGQSDRGNASGETILTISRHIEKESV